MYIGNNIFQCFKYSCSIWEAVCLIVLHISLVLIVSESKAARIDMICGLSVFNAIVL